MVAAGTIVLLMFGLAAAIGAAHGEVVRGLRTRTRAVKWWTGWALLGAGAWLVTLAVFAATFAEVFPV